MDLTISEIKNISKITKETFNIDLSYFGSESLRSRLRNVMSAYECKNGENLVLAIQAKKITKDDFLSYFSVPYSEMFRDPAMWRKLKKELIEKVKDYKPYKIFIPSCTTGDEYYTVLVLLNELNLLDKVKITVSSWSDKNIETIKDVKISTKKVELNRANYKRFEGKDELGKYFESNKLKTLQSNTKFIKVDFINSELPTNQDLVIFRNKFIYLTEDAQDKMVDKLYECLKLGGKLIIGIKENIYLNNSVKEKFIEECDSERIYKKK